ncbi:MAG: hypothetical protein U9R79_02730, partial [Armatimonadota bacterium]|nr:hypothetical protein [Armatimonadota bacterium]
RKAPMIAHQQVRHDLTENLPAKPKKAHNLGFLPANDCSLEACATMRFGQARRSPCRDVFPLQTAPGPHVICAEDDIT